METFDKLLSVGYSNFNNTCSENWVIILND